MKRFFGMLLLTAGLQVSAFAQEQTGNDGRMHRTPEERANRQTEMMNSKLGLSEEQRTRVYDVNLKTARQTAKFNGPGDTANFRAVQVARDEAYKKILNPGQLKQYETLKEERKARRGEMHERRHNEQ